MRKIILGATLIFLFSISAFAQTAEEIVEKHINAVGGLDKWTAVNSQKITGNLSMSGMEFPFVSYSKRPNMNYTEVTFQGMTMKQAYDGNIGWMINPMAGSTKAEKMDDDMTKTIKNRGVIGGELLNYKELGCTIELIGKEDLEGTEVYNIKLTNKDGDIENYYIDAVSSLIIKSTSKMKRMGKEISSETIYSNYKPSGDVIEAFSVESKMQGMDMGSQKIIIDKIEQNITIDDNMFKMPVE
jgi:hypothetical protein